MLVNQYRVVVFFFVVVASMLLKQPEIKTRGQQFNLIATEKSILININAVNKVCTQPDVGEDNLRHASENRKRYSWKSEEKQRKGCTQAEKRK